MTNNILINIYCYKEKSTGIPKYVGKTKRTLKKRAGGSKGYCYIHDGGYFGKAIEKNGFDSFEPEILTTTKDPEYASLLEWFYTVEFDTQWPNGYNENIGNLQSERVKQLAKERNIGKPQSKETRQKRSDSLKGHKGWNKGIPISEKVKDIIREKNTKKRNEISKLYRQNNLGLTWNRFQKYMREKLTN